MKPAKWQQLILILGACLTLAALSAAEGQPADSTSPSRASKPPNVLFIAIDDLNDWLGCMGGHPQAQTPNMDRLAARGTLFANAHVQAPICNPSRSSLLTGFRPSTTGMYGFGFGIRDVAMVKDCVTLPQYFARHGYFTASFGKVFHDSSIPRHLQTNEFNVWGASPFVAQPKKKFVQTPDPRWVMDWGVFPADDRQQPDWKTADNAIAQLKTRPQDKPFFLAVGFRLPHVPLFVSQKWFDLFPEDKVILPPIKGHAFERDGVPFCSWFLQWKLPEPSLSWLIQSNQWRPIVRSYLACTTFVDSQIGRVLDAIEASGEATNTVVVLWSDNGWHLGEKNILGKRSLWERSTRVPLIFAGPGVARAAKCTQPAELLDIYPTLVELCGLPAKPGIEGHSLVPQAQNAEAKRLWPAITTHHIGNHAVRTERWRYIRYANGEEELYDMLADPNEWHNLASDPKHKPVILDLAKWLPQVNLPPVPGSDDNTLTLQDGNWLLGGKPLKMEDLDR